MANIYMVADTKVNAVYVKVGYTTRKLEQRLSEYQTYNPRIFCLDSMETYRKTATKRERASQIELEALGFERVRGQFDNRLTEWFIIPTEHPFYTELLEHGLQALACNRGRKSLGGLN